MAVGRKRPIGVPGFCVAMAMLLGMAETVHADPPRDGDTAEPDASPSPPRRTSPPDPIDREFMIGLEGVGLQVPTLRTPLAPVETRLLGSSVALGGVGLLGRYRPVPLVGFELGARSGSLRYRADDSDDSVSQDLVVFSAGVLLYLARGDVGQFALDAGIGGIYNRVGYDIGEDRTGVQHFGSGHVRVGVDAEFLLKRIAIVMSLRSYGVFTKRDIVQNEGRIFTDASADQRNAPMPRLQTYIAASAGLAYRF